MVKLLKLVTLKPDDEELLDEELLEEELLEELELELLDEELEELLLELEFEPLDELEALLLELELDEDELLIAPPPQALKINAKANKLKQGLKFIWRHGAQMRARSVLKVFT